MKTNVSSELSKTIDASLNSLNSETRQKLCEMVKDPLFTPVYDVSIRNQKELAQQRLKKIADAKLVSVKDFTRNPENIFTMHELVSINIKGKVEIKRERKIRECLFEVKHLNISKRISSHQAHL